MDETPAGWQQLPLFPLNNVLFPDGPLPLQIFEPRYLEMVSRCHAAGTPFGVVCLSEGREIRTPGDGGFAKESLCPVGTLARIDVLERPQAALMVALCTGGQRFRIHRSAQQRFGLWVAEVETLVDDLPVAVPDDLAWLRDHLRALFEERQDSASARGSGEADTFDPLPRSPRWNDCGWLANRWCELLPLPAAEKQRLLELESPLLRLELVSDALARMGLSRPRPD